MREVAVMEAGKMASLHCLQLHFNFFLITTKTNKQEDDLRNPEMEPVGNDIVHIFQMMSILFN